MTYTLLKINILTSDQYGRTEDKFIGIFDNSKDLENAEKWALLKYKNYPNIITKTEILPNVVCDR